MRRTLIGPPQDIVYRGGVLEASFKHRNNMDILLMLMATTAGLRIMSQIVYHRSIRRAWWRGKIEETQGM